MAKRMTAQRERIAEIYADRHLSKHHHTFARKMIKKHVSIIRACESGNVAREVYKRRAMSALSFY